MKIVITGSAKEIAALVLAVQGRQKVESLTIGGVSTKAHGNDLIVEHGQNGEVHICGYCTTVGGDGQHESNRKGGEEV